MKIYGKHEVVFGIFGICFVILAHFDIISVEWALWQYVFWLAISITWLSQGLSKTKMEYKKIINDNFKEVATRMYGRFYAVKLSLPWIISGVFLCNAIILTYIVDIWFPDWLGLIYVVSLTISAFYSIGIMTNVNKEIEVTVIQKEVIENNECLDDQNKSK